MLKKATGDFAPLGLAGWSWSSCFFVWFCLYWSLWFRISGFFSV